MTLALTSSKVKVKRKENSTKISSVAHIIDVLLKTKRMASFTVVYQVLVTLLLLYLVSLHGYEVDSAEDVKKLELLAKEQYEKFVKSVLVEDRTEDVMTPIKKNKYKLFQNPTARKKSAAEKKVQSSKDHAGLFAKLFVTLQTRGGDLALFFQHESAVPPPSMKPVTDKASLLHCILQESANNSDEAMYEEAPQFFDAVVLDGGNLIHSLAPKPSVNTFDDFVSEMFCPYLRQQLRSWDELHVVWDRYFKKSIKAQTREQRQTGNSRQRVSGGARVPQTEQVESILV